MQLQFARQCGDIYRRVHWNNRGYKSIVWRCVSRLEEKGSECTAPTIKEETLQTAVVKAINELLANKDPFLKVLQKNIATVFNGENDNATDDIDSKLEELQQREIFIQDQFNAIKLARRLALEEGEKKGREEEKIEIAQQLLSILDDETISRTTGLSLEEVKKLRTGN